MSDPKSAPSKRRSRTCRPDEWGVLDRIASEDGMVVDYDAAERLHEAGLLAKEEHLFGPQKIPIVGWWMPEPVYEAWCGLYVGQTHNA